MLSLAKNTTCKKGLSASMSHRLVRNNNLNSYMPKAMIATQVDS
jgi:hypothetical protein